MEKLKRLYNKHNNILLELIQQEKEFESNNAFILAVTKRMLMINLIQRYELKELKN